MVEKIPLILWEIKTRDFFLILVKLEVGRKMH